jgi:hypothetical protein
LEPAQPGFLLLFQTLENRARRTRRQTLRVRALTAGNGNVALQVCLQAELLRYSEELG